MGQAQVLPTCFVLCSPPPRKSWPVYDWLPRQLSPQWEDTLALGLSVTGFHGQSLARQCDAACQPRKVGWGVFGHERRRHKHGMQA